MAHARRRLGVDPVRHLFEALASKVEPPAHFHGRRAWAMDGTVLTVQDTAANEAAFGRHVAAVATQLVSQGAEFLYRLKSNVRPRVTRRRAHGDCDVTLTTRTRGEDATWSTLTLDARMIVYSVGRETVRLLTNVFDDRVQAMDLITLYHERCEVELAFDEIKAHLAAPASYAVDTTFRGLSWPSRWRSPDPSWRP